VNYTIILTPEGQARVRQLPPDVQAILPEHFAALAERPVSLSFPGAPPASLPDRQIYAFPANFPDGRLFTVRVHFRYGQDETTLHVFSVTAVPHS
jgi:hypothetical protein